MSLYSKIKQEKTNKYSQLFDDCKVFFAFSDERFKEKFEDLKAGGETKVIHIGAGGFLPKSYQEKWETTTKEIEKWYKEEVKKIKANEKETHKMIAYELSNHECYYTGDIDVVIELFDGVYTPEQIKKVYKKELPKQDF